MLITLSVLAIFYGLRSKWDGWSGHKLIFEPIHGHRNAPWQTNGGKRHGITHEYHL